MEFPKLNFSRTYDFKFRKDKDKFFIYDLPRKSWIILTPEEWVRQHWIHYFLENKGKNTSSLIIEKKIELLGLTKRIDLLVTEKTHPITLVECKAPHIKLNEKSFEQIARYNIQIGAKEIILSNGLQHIFARWDGIEYHFSPFIE
ncbi:MAG: type I restriction enzyme HsdR N-terminal domain-containing protein [Bacteroidetes bacterium]|jgi:hypothetical protein|nr:type I restriction enzyme HsdR N-terminal domain-containing protein [Bacteroidota bacterium]